MEFIGAEKFYHGARKEFLGAVVEFLGAGLEVPGCKMKTKENLRAKTKVVWSHLRRTSPRNACHRIECLLATLRKYAVQILRIQPQKNFATQCLPQNDRMFAYHFAELKCRANTPQTVVHFFTIAICSSNLFFTGLYPRSVAHVQCGHSPQVP